MVGEENAPALMQVSYQLTAEDIPAIQAALYRPAWGARHWGRHERWRLLLAGAALALLLFFLIKLYVTKLTGADLIPWLDALGAVAAGAFAGWWWGGRKQAPLSADSPQLEPHTLTLDAQGFRHCSSGVESLISWRRVRQVRQVDGYLLLTTAWHDLFAVPLRAFTCRDEADEFYSQAVELRRAALSVVGNLRPDRPIECLNYQLQREDVRSLLALNGTSGWRGVLLWLLPVVAAVIAVNLNRQTDDGTWWSAFLLAIAAGWGVARVLLQVERQIAVARYPLPKGEIELQRWGAHLALVTDGKDEIFGYELIEKVVATDRHIFVFTTIREAIIIPRRAFSDDDELADFAADIERSCRFEGG